MKNKMMVTLAAVTLLGSSFSIEAIAKSKTGTLYINGIVTSGSCQVSVNEGGKEGVVELPDIHSSELVNGTAVKKTTFDIVLSNCIPAKNKDGANGKVSLHWSNAVMADKDKGYLENTLTETAAKNVYLTMSDKDSSSVIIPGTFNNTNVQSKEVSSNGSVKFSYEVGYITPDSKSAKAGLVQSKAVYMVSYE